MAAPRPSDPADMRAEQQARLFEPPPNLGKEGRSSHDVDESVVAGQGQGHHWSEGDQTASNHRALDDRPDRENGGLGRLDDRGALLESESAHVHDREGCPAEILRIEFARARPTVQLAVQGGYGGERQTISRTQDGPYEPVLECDGAGEIDLLENLDGVAREPCVQARVKRERFGTGLEHHGREGDRRFVGERGGERHVDTRLAV